MASLLLSLLLLLLLLDMTLKERVTGYRQTEVIWLSPSYQSPAPIRMFHVVPGHYPFPPLYIKASRSPSLPQPNSLQMSTMGHLI